jgi:hypothetical protein
MAVLSAMSTVLIFIAALFGFYVPNFGVDTWRDSMQATQIIERGVLTNLGITHKAYPFPIVSILYALIAMMLGLNTLWSSSIVGLLYIFSLSLWTYIVTRHMSEEYTHTTTSILLLLSTPHIIMWSVAFIPQAYSMLLTLPLLFLDLELIAMVLISISIILGHGGVSLWTLIILIFIFLAERLSKAKNSYINSRHTKTKLTTFSLILVVYTAYVILNAIKEGVSAIIETLMYFLIGTKIVHEDLVIATVPLWASLILLVPYVILVFLGYIILLEQKDLTLRLLAFASIISLGSVFIKIVIGVRLDLERYIGMPAAVLLSILAPKALTALVKRGSIGLICALVLLFASISSLGLGGVLMPENPYVATSYTFTFSAGSLTYIEASELEKLLPLLRNNVVFVDLKAGLYLGYKCSWTTLGVDKVICVREGIGFNTRNICEPHTSNCLLIFRERGLTVQKAYVPELVPSLLKLLSEKYESAFVYNGKNVEVFIVKNNY